ncbi:MAG: sugar phosphate isomerase/epimerase [Candidatus Hydrogenedentes bacterium]|nr:sugar phosphate isomerase/epimerase [Candidatus Hydrogenedentota bacterium]
MRPLRLGTTSYIVPDDILPNLRHLSGRVDDVELVLFESDESSNLPSPGDVAEMGRLAREAGLSYTVHLPLDTRTGCADEAERAESVAKCLRVVQLTTPLAPFAWIMHLHGDRRGEPPTDEPARWLRQHRRSLQELLRAGIEPSAICIETLDYDFERVAGLVNDFDLAVCLDLGHLLVNGRDVAAHLDRWFSRARVFHVHGVRPDGTDHAHIGYLPDGLLEDLAQRIAALPVADARVVTLEVFGEDDFERSMEVVQERMAPWLR